MVLSKEVCEACVNKNRTQPGMEGRPVPRPWGAEDDQAWVKGALVCSGGLHWLIGAGSPLACPYTAEHVVSQES